MLALLLLAAVAPVDVKSVEVAWQTAHDGYPAQGPAYVRSDDDVTVSLLVHFADGTCAVREGAWQDRAGVDHLCERELDELRDHRVEWFIVKPASMRVERDARGVGPSLAHRNEPWARSTPDRVLLVEGPACPASDDEFAPCGTMRLAARLEAPSGETLAFTPDATDPAQAFALHIRLDDGPSGVMSELANVPRVDAPRGAPPSQHETELGLGVDGSAAVIHMARRLGVQMPYAGWDALHAQMTVVDVGKARVKPGDVLQAGNWIAVLHEDRGKQGALDPVDKVLWVGEGPLDVMTVGALPAGTQVHVYRIKGLQERVPQRRYRTVTRRKVVDVRRDAGEPTR